MTPIKAVSSPIPSYKAQPNSKLLSKLTADNFSLIVACVGIEFNKFARTCRQFACLIQDQGTWHLLAEARLPKEMLPSPGKAQSAPLPWRDLTKQHVGVDLAQALIVSKGNLPYRPLTNPLFLAHTKNHLFFADDVEVNACLPHEKNFMMGRQIGHITRGAPLKGINYCLPDLNSRVGELSRTIERITASDQFVAAVERQPSRVGSVPVSKHLHVWRQGEPERVLHTLHLPPFTLTVCLRLIENKLFLGRFKVAPQDVSSTILVSYDMGTGKELFSLKPSSLHETECVMQVERGVDPHTFLALHSANPIVTARLWDSRTLQRPVRNWAFNTLPDSICRTFCTSAMSLYTASASLTNIQNDGDSYIRNWDIGTGRCIKGIKIKQDVPQAMTMGGDILYTGGSKGTVRAFSTWNSLGLSFLGKFALPLRKNKPQAITYMDATFEHLTLFSHDKKAEDVVERFVNPGISEFSLWDFKLPGSPSEAPVVAAPAAGAAAAAGAGAGAAAGAGAGKTPPAATF